ncbi:hypothetical protein M406DRAFT_342099 [Cryphonectria parasitica EP155]|uniref:Cyclin-D1-binding protein 1-like N-terminal domain-containing protein n=1 Tax=Cryphonectria parasitica (strain ATCC 38755 / EP155) TaxID=660469 RepID=A0A9P4XV99_CRYP1|nr:uncharacterized protein M406DRAFT_342099 [Cryphonectria parasitica EP155]KAF3761265.1 hypothetical protein M406DRAFT_342099 [Cryphonectria parasitica EP155]
MPQSPASSGALEELASLTNNAVLLIEGIEQSLRSLDCLALARDSASLIKAYSTKISLFIINEPFTPSAICTVLRQLIQGAVPAVASAVQQCNADLYTKVIRRDLAWRCARLLRELRELLQKIPSDGKVLPENQRNGLSGAKAEKGSIVATGVLWGLCDEVISFANLGVAKHLVHKAEHLRDTLKDVLEELKEWSEEQDGVDDDEDEDDDEAEHENEDEVEVDHLADGMNNTHISTQAMLDSFMDSQQNIPRGDPEKIRERLESTLRRLRLTVLLYQALIKRRLKTLPKLPLTHDADSVTVSRLDEVMPLLRRITDRFNSLAVAFYELDSAEITTLMDQCFFDAFAVSELLAKPWDGQQKDEFTEWVAKFQVEIKKN